MVKSKGFTLIELMIVISIIGILAAVVPAFKEKLATSRTINTTDDNTSAIMMIGGVKHKCDVDGDCTPIE